MGLDLQGLLCAAILALACHGWGQALLRRPLLSGWRAPAGVCLAIGCGLTAIAMALAGLFGGCTMWLLLAWAAAGVAVGAYTQARLPAAATAGWSTTLLPEWRQLPRPWRLLLLAGALLLLLPPFLAASAPPVSGAAVHRHLLLVNWYWNQGGLTPLWDVAHLALAPQFGETLLILPFGLGGTGAVQYFCLFQWFSCAWLLYSLAASAGLAGLPGLAAAACLFFHGPVIRLLPEAGNGALLTQSLLAALALVQAGADKGASQSCPDLPRAQGRRLALLAGMCAGVAMGSSLEAAWFAAPVLVYTVFAWRGRDSAARLPLFCLAALAAAGFWAGRNWHLAGNPFWPLFAGSFGSGPAGKTAFIAAMRDFQIHSDPAAIARLPVKLFVLPANGFAAGGGVLSPLLLAGLAALPAYLRRQRSALAWLALATLLGGAAGFWLNDGRLTPLLPGIAFGGGLAVAMAMDECRQREPRWRRGFAILCFAALGLAAAQSAGFHYEAGRFTVTAAQTRYFDRSLPRTGPHGQVTGDAFLLNNVLSPELHRLLLVGAAPGCHLEIPWITTAALEREFAAGATDWGQACSRLGVTHVYWSLGESYAAPAGLELTDELQLPYGWLLTVKIGQAMPE